MKSTPPAIEPLPVAEGEPTPDRNGCGASLEEVSPDNLDAYVSVPSQKRLIVSVKYCIGGRGLPMPFADVEIPEDEGSAE